MTNEQKEAVIVAVQQHGVVGIRDDALDEAQDFVDQATRAYQRGLITPAVVNVLTAAGYLPTSAEART